MTRTARATLLVIASSLATWSCGAFERRTDPTQYFVLATLTESAAGVRRAKSIPAALLVGLGPVIVPKYLDRPEIVRRVGPSQVSISDYERWAEPFSGNVVRVLATNLSSLLDPARLVVFPWTPSLNPAYEVRVSIERFEASGQGTVDLVARWIVRTERARDVVETRDSIITYPVASASTADAVAAMSAVLGKLSEEIAAAIQQAAG